LLAPNCLAFQIYICIMRRTPSIDALIKLIDDPDHLVFEQVRAEILRAGTTALPKLHDLLDFEKLSAEHIERVQSLMKELHFAAVMENLEAWCVSSSKDLLKGLHIITSFQFPDLTFESLSAQVHVFERRIWLEVNRRMTAFEIVERMNTMWYSNIGLTVERTQKATPYQTFLNTAMEDLSGTPLSTGLIYSIVAQRLNLPVYGVNFPGQFVLAYIDEYRIHKLIEPLGTGGVLFYLLPIDCGKALIRKQLDEVLFQKRIPPVREYFEPCSHSSLLILYLDELIQVYERHNRSELVLAYQQMKTRILELA
jgi:regulator of sirC expression with transglutaminase-like and TPR domain